jgi:hypothetical protein
MTMSTMPTACPARSEGPSGGPGDPVHPLRDAQAGIAEPGEARATSTVWQRLSDQRRVRREQMTVFIALFKTRMGCADCGYRAHPAALDFDHRPGEVKLFSINEAKRKSWMALHTEIGKCDIVCANCHRIRTANRKQWGGR